MLDTDEIVARQVEQLEKEKKEMTEKLRAQEKKVDYFERAKRLKELDILQEKYESDAIKFRKMWEEFEQSRVSEYRCFTSFFLLLCFQLFNLHNIINIHT